MPKTSAETSTAMTALGSTNVDESVVHVDLHFVGVAFDPAALRTALDTQYGTVVSEVDGAERPLGPFRYRISA